MAEVMTGFGTMFSFSNQDREVNVPKVLQRPCTEPKKPMSLHIYYYNSAATIVARISTAVAATTILYGTASNTSDALGPAYENACMYVIRRYRIQQ